MPNKPSFEVSSDVDKCTEYLANHDRVSYNELSSYLGRKINGRDRYVLESARRRLERRRGVVFVVERGVGVVRATNKQVAQLSTDVPIRQVRRITNKAKKREIHVNVQELSEDERLAFYIGRVVVNAIGKNTLKSFRSQIKAEIERHGGEMIESHGGGMITLHQVAALQRHRK
jgi:hypothetical protein